MYSLVKLYTEVYDCLILNKLLFLHSMLITNYKLNYTRSPTQTLTQGSSNLK